MGQGPPVIEPGGCVLVSRGKRERGIVEDPESGGGTKAGSDGTERGLRENFTDVWRRRFGVGVGPDKTF